MTRGEYVLRARDREEIARLMGQQEAWRDETAAVLTRAGFAAGDCLLDLGCGPGALTLDLARIVGQRGRVLGIDSSELFVEFLRERVHEEEWSSVEAEVADLCELDLPPSSFDGAVCRWVLMFVAQPSQVLRHVARAVRPGGTIAVMEYGDFRSMSLRPKGAYFDRVYGAVHELIAQMGGDADIGDHVPALLEEAGFEVREVVPVRRQGVPASPLWEWLEGTHVNLNQLVSERLLAARDLEHFHTEWSEAASTPDAVFTAPPVMATIARRI